MNGWPSPIRSRRPPCRRAPAVAAGVEAAGSFCHRRSASARAPILLAGLLGLAACAETGDFGRRRASVWNDLILPTAGAVAARGREEPVSSFPFTDDEGELRDRAYRFLAPAHERSWFDAQLAALTRSRVLPVDAHPRDRAAYFEALSGDGARSPASRYRRLAEDALADAALIGPFVTVAERVQRADSARLRSLLYVRDLAEGDVRNAAARVAENRCLVAWVRVETARRMAAYRYALEHLVIASPQGEAVGAERAVAVLDGARRSLGVLGTPPLAAACGEALQERRFTPRGPGRAGAAVVKD